MRTSESNRRTIVTEVANEVDKARKRYTVEHDCAHHGHAGLVAAAVSVATTDSRHSARWADAFHDKPVRERMVIAAGLLVAAIETYDAEHRPTILAIASGDRAEVLKELRAFDLPDNLRLQLAQYLVDRKPPVALLAAVLQNDLKRAFAHAHSDFHEGRLGGFDPFIVIRSVLAFLNTEAPARAWGSPEAVSTWLANPEARKAPLPDTMAVKL